MIKIFISFFLLTILSSCMLYTKNKARKSQPPEYYLGLIYNLRENTSIVHNSDEENCILEQSKKHVSSEKIIEACKIKDGSTKIGIEVVYRSKS